MSIILYIIGLCLGSFLNVAIDRPFQKRSVIAGRSQCDFCHRTLSWFDLVPVFSFIFLGGKCKYCHKRLSIQYPLVELATAVLFVFIFFLYGNQDFIVLISLLIIAASSVFLFVTDLKYQILPDIGIVCLGLGTLLYSLFSHGDMIGFRLLIGMISALPFGLIFFFSKGKGMGFGDVKLTFVLGFLLSFPSIVIALYIAFLTGAAVAIILILKKKKKFRGSTIAFGPFLLVGAGAAFVWGNLLLRYVRMIIGF